MDRGVDAMTRHGGVWSDGKSSIPCRHLGNIIRLDAKVRNR